MFGSTIHVQLVDWEVISNAIKPYTIYTIVAKHEHEGIIYGRMEMDEWMNGKTEEQID